MVSIKSKKKKNWNKKSLNKKKQRMKKNKLNKINQIKYFIYNKIKHQHIQIYIIKKYKCNNYFIYLIIIK